jgi:hypothetical protein
VEALNRATIFFSGDLSDWNHWQCARVLSMQALPRCDFKESN